MALLAALPPALSDRLTSSPGQEWWGCFGSQLLAQENSFIHRKEQLDGKPSSEGWCFSVSFSDLRVLMWSDRQVRVNQQSPAVPPSFLGSFDATCSALALFFFLCVGGTLIFIIFDSSYWDQSHFVDLCLGLWILEKPGCPRAPHLLPVCTNTFPWAELSFHWPCSHFNGNKSLHF